MSEYAARANEILTAQIGAAPLVGDWMEISQQRIQDFADATLDHQFIHVDPERAAETPFGGTVAHGFLTLSLLVHLSTSLPAVPLEGVAMGINYGLNKVRFIAPVPSGARVRASATTDAVVLKGNAIDRTRTFTIEIEGSDKPALIAEWIDRRVFD